MVRPSPVLVAVVTPTTIHQGETVTVFGGLIVPEGTFELGTYSCGSASCRHLTWRTLKGPGEIWADLGLVRFDGPGVGTIELRVFEADTVTERVVGVWRRDVTVVAGIETPTAQAAQVPTSAKVR